MRSWLRHVRPKKIQKTEAEWRELLTPEQFHVMREKGTERAFTGALLNNHDDRHVSLRSLQCSAVYVGQEVRLRKRMAELLAAGFGDAIEAHEDNTHGMRRIEVTCANCGAHLGHVFPDGPKPTGMRYCINSASLGLRRQ